MSRWPAMRRADESLRPIVVGAVALAVALLIPIYRLQSLSWGEAAAASAMFVVPGVILGAIVWRLLTRPARPRPRAHALAVHAAAAIGFAAVWTFAFAGLALLLGKTIGLGYVREGGVWQFFWGLVIYGVLIQAARARERLKEKELAAAAAELQALRAQLDPHFLFNTLHSLTQLAREDPVATQEALERFGGLMRYVLTAGRPMRSEVALEEELEFVRHYLALEHLRLGDRLHVIEDIEPDATELAIPPLLLQPLLENAVRHGIAPLREGGTIRISGRIASGSLVLQVADDGRGCGPDAWRSATGLGLRAVERQLRASAAESRMCIETDEGAGFAVTLNLPVRLAAAAHS